MQFHHPHFFRRQVADALLAEMPEVWHALLAAGAQPAALPAQPGVLAGLHCRRVSFERALRSAAEAEPGVTLHTGHVDEVSAERGRATGVRVDRHQVAADLVIDAGGRAGRLTRGLRAPAEGGDCGIAYVSRQYQMMPGAPHGPVNAPFGVIETYPGWDADLIRRWSGQDVDLTRPLPPDLITAAAQADPEIMKAVGPYQAMLTLPGSLDAVQARARDIYASGWRPPIPPGPTREELADLVTSAASSHSRRKDDAA